ncbi:MAG: hypothetical protein ABSC06_01280 [Rhodopila sp.]|jgi:hypothetical protein
MRKTARRHVCAVAALLCVAASEDRDTLKGWGDFTFDMSRAQVKQAGQDKLNESNVGGEYGFIESMRDIIEIAGKAYTGTIFFSKDDAHVRAIRLTPFDGNWKGLWHHQDVLDCLQQEEAAASWLTDMYGSPNVSRQHRDLRRSFEEIVLGLTEKHTTETVYAFSDGASIVIQNRTSERKSDPLVDCRVTVTFLPPNGTDLDR